VIRRFELLLSSQNTVLPSAIQKGRSQIPLKLENVTHFSYGQYDDGEVDIWAAGGAGWFKIKPASSYKRTFQHMIKGVDVFYFIADAYSGQPRLSPEQLFAMYANKRKISEKNAKDTIYMHGRFLASRMIKGSEDIKWGHTAIYQHLRTLFPEFFEAIKAEPEMPPRRTKTQAQPPAPDLVKDISQKLPQPHRRGVDTKDDSKKPNEKMERKGSASYGLQKDDIKTRVNAVWNVIQKSANEQQLNPKSMTLQTFAEATYETFTFDDEIQAADYIIFLAPELVSKIQHKHLSKRLWTDSTFYSELLEADISRSTKAKMAQLNVRRRLSATVVSSHCSDDSEASSSSEEEVVNTRSGRHIKGGLRPKACSKGPGRKGKSYTGPSNPETMDLDDISEASTPHKRKNGFRGDKPSKRRQSVISSDTSSPHSQELEPETQPNRQPSTAFLPSSPDTSQSFLTLMSTPALDTTANAPGDKWCCQHVDCNHAVYGASTDTSQELILEHLAEHDEKMKLVFNEKHLTNLPVGNLIRRIREISALQNGYGPMRGVIPTMIQRAL